MIDKIARALGVKLMRAAIPGMAEALADHAVATLQKHLVTQQIDPLTPQQERQIKACLAALLLASSSPSASDPSTASP